MNLRLSLTIALLCLGIVGAAVPTSDCAAQRTLARTPVDLGPGAPTPGADPFLWLEDVHGARALSWVNAEDAKSAAVFEHDPHYPSLFADAKIAYEHKNRIPYPEMIGGQVYNFWRDPSHVRGILRRTTLASYQSSSPTWTTVIDLDAIAKSEKANWVFEGIYCAEPAEQRCIVQLSDGGEDAQTLREFDLRTDSFVDGGFALPRAKQTAVWQDENTLLVARPWTAADVTASGYPYIVKRIQRGQALSGAVELFRGKTTDVSDDPLTLDDGAGHHVALILQGLDFFNARYYLLRANAVQQLGLPEQVNIEGLVGGRLVLTLNQPWTVDGTKLPEGALVSIDLAALNADPTHLHPSLVYAPGPRESLGSISATRNALLVVSYLNVEGRLLEFKPAATGWSQQALTLPPNSTIDIADSNIRDDTAWVSATTFLTPTSLYRVDAGDGATTKVKALPPQFDASHDVVEQHEATSRDGTKIPYFIVHPKSMTFDGDNPTVINAYGGFQISQTPFYSSAMGKLWLAHGGTFVLANIRGGGEFGPAWHDAGLKTHRQRIYDDFYAVAQDLIARKITCPRRLGIMGGSNGGLLMGVEFTQHPEMYDAVDIEVPLLDMLRYEKIEAGASWVGEYGSVSVPAERAFLASISPYSNLHPGTAYPEPFVWTTTKDDRVGPEHARKFAAKLASMGVPYLFYEVVEGGHGAGANLDEDAQTVAFEWTYFTSKLMTP